MRKNMKIYYLLLIIIFFISGSPVSAQNAAQGPVRIIFDTDMDSDVDDAGALAMLHALMNRGEVEILAVMISSTSPASAACAGAINTYYGRADIPIGSSKTGPNAEQWYHDSVGNFPHDLGSSDDAPDAVALYRKILSAQPDHSVTIVTVGWLTNMADLLNSKPDRYSLLFTGIIAVASAILLFRFQYLLYGDPFFPSKLISVKSTRNDASSRTSLNSVSMLIL